MSDVHAVEQLWMGDGIEPSGKGPDRSTTDCATIQPNAGLFIFIYLLSASADTKLVKSEEPDVVTILIKS